eukprot:s407_g5.t1
MSQSVGYLLHQRRLRSFRTKCVCASWKLHTCQRVLQGHLLLAHEPGQHEDMATRPTQESRKNRRPGKVRQTRTSWDDFLPWVNRLPAPEEPVRMPKAEDVPPAPFHRSSEHPNGGRTRTSSMSNPS